MSELHSSPDTSQASEPVNELFQGLPPLVARGLVYLLLAILLTAVGYSFIGQVNEIVTARAMMTPRGLLRPVQAATAGRVARVAAREGERVERGQVVVYLETEAAQAQLERARQELEIRRGQLQETLAGQADALQVSEARARVAQAEADRVAAEKALDAGMIVAPATGQLTQLHVRGTGEAVAPGQTVAEVAPGDAPLVFEVQVANSDIGRVRVGQSAIIKVDAYPHQEYGTVDGQVVSIAPDATPAAGGGSTYRVTVVPVLSARPPTRKAVSLRLGLAATVEIVADRRRIIDLLIRTIRGGV